MSSILTTVLVSILMFLVQCTSSSVRHGVVFIHIEENYDEAEGMFVNETLTFKCTSNCGYIDFIGHSMDHQLDKHSKPIQTSDSDKIRKDQETTLGLAKYYYTSSNTNGEECKCAYHTLPTINATLKFTPLSEGHYFFYCKNEFTWPSWPREYTHSKVMEILVKRNVTEATTNSSVQTVVNTSTISNTSTSSEANITSNPRVKTLTSSSSSVRTITSTISVTKTLVATSCSPNNSPSTSNPDTETVTSSSTITQTISSKPPTFHESSSSGLRATTLTSSILAVSAVIVILLVFTISIIGYKLLRAYRTRHQTSTAHTYNCEAANPTVIMENDNAQLQHEELTVTSDHHE